MGIWVQKPILAATERVEWTQNANRTQSEQRAVGGRLFLTDTRLLFQPSRFDARTGGDLWSAPLDAIRRVGDEPPDGNRRSGGLRTRPRVALADGGVEFFVVNHVGRVIEVIRRAVGQSN